jgi:hypothetical protein
MFPFADHPRSSTFSRFELDTTNIESIREICRIFRLGESQGSIGLSALIAQLLPNAKGSSKSHLNHRVSTATRRGWIQLISKKAATETVLIFVSTGRHDAWPLMLLFLLLHR